MGVVIRQSIKGTLMNYIGVVIGFVTTFFIVTNYLTTEEVGLAKVLVDSAILLSGLAQLGTTSSAMRYYPFFKDEEKKDNGFFGWTLIVPLVGFIIFGALFLLFKEPLAHHFSQQSPLFVNYMYFVLPMAFFMLYLSVFETNSNLLLRIVVPKTIREVGIRLMTMLTYLLYAFRWINLDEMVICLCATYLIATLLNVLYLLRLKRVSFKIQRSFVNSWLRRDFLLYTSFLVISSLTTIIAPLLNTFFISVKMGLAITGVYTIAQYAANLIEVPYRSLGSISRPHISQAIKDNDFNLVDDLVKKITTHQFLASVFIFFLIWINIDTFYGLLPNGEIYREGRLVLLFLAVCKVINSSLNVIYTVLNYSKYYYWSLFFTAILTVSAIILNVTLIPIWGMEGAGIASLSAYFIYYLLLFIFVKWKIGIQPFNVAQGKVFVIIVLMLLINDLSVDFLAGRVIDFFSSRYVGLIVDSILRTVFIGGIGCAVVYLWNVSPYIKSLIPFKFKNKK